MAEPVSTSVQTALLVSAATGGAVSALRRKGPWWVRFSAGFSGAAACYFLTPIAAPIAELAIEKAIVTLLGTPLDLDTAGVWGAVGFLIGSTGLELMEILVDVLRGERRLSDLLGGRTKPAA